MTLDMLGTIDQTFAADPDGGVELVVREPGGYTGPGGTWEDGAETVTTLPLVSIQQASMRTAEFLMQVGGSVNPSDLRVVYINDGTQLYPDDNDDQTVAHFLRFSDGRDIRDWRVREVDNRPWRNYCKAIVERYRGTR